MKTDVNQAERLILNQLGDFTQICPEKKNEYFLTENDNEKKTIEKKKKK